MRHQRDTGGTRLVARVVPKTVATDIFGPPQMGDSKEKSQREKSEKSDTQCFPRREKSDTQGKVRHPMFSPRRSQEKSHKLTVVPSS
jgi:hypothetical protein